MYDLMIEIDSSRAVDNKLHFKLFSIESKVRPNKLAPKSTLNRWNPTKIKQQQLPLKWQLQIRPAKSGFSAAENVTNSVRT